MLPNNLKYFVLILKENDLGVNEQNMEFLKDGMEQLPINLYGLEFYLEDNYLGNKTENMKFLGEILK